MSYLVQGVIAGNAAMLTRVAQAAAEEGRPDPDGWTYTHRRTWAAAPGWDDAWESALVSHPPIEGQDEYDPGRDEGVITDSMILSQVQSMATLA